MNVIPFGEAVCLEVNTAVGDWLAGLTVTVCEMEPVAPKLSVTVTVTV